MSLEPITRKEKIIAGENLEPITRLEKFLKEYGGSGGSGGGGSTDAVLYTAQTLTDAQKKQARQNIDAAIADFVVNGTFGSDGTVTLNKTFAQIQAAVQEGKRPAINVTAGVNSLFMPMVTASEKGILFSSEVSPLNRSASFNSIKLNPTGVAKLAETTMPTFDTDGFFPQFNMASDPIDTMQIATKKYVDDKECILKSTTPGSTKKFKMTVDDSGNISATEVT